MFVCVCGEGVGGGWVWGGVDGCAFACLHVFVYACKPSLCLNLCYQNIRMSKRMCLILGL